MPQEPRRVSQPIDEAHCQTHAEGSAVAQGGKPSYRWETHSTQTQDKLAWVDAAGTNVRSTHAPWHDPAFDLGAARENAMHSEHDIAL